MNESHAAPIAKTIGMRKICPLDERNVAAALSGAAFGGGGRFSTWTASFIPPKQNPLPLMK